jgi:hypothetical protein
LSSPLVLSLPPSKTNHPFCASTGPSTKTTIAFYQVCLSVAYCLPHSLPPTIMLSFIDSALNGSTANASPNAVASNIQHYLANSNLPNMRLAPSTPPMPLAGHKTHRNYLSIRPERYRKLRHMHRFKNAYVDKATLDCMYSTKFFIGSCCRLLSIVVRDHIPNKPLPVDDEDPETGEQPCIPCEGYEVQYYGAPPLRNLDEYVIWNLGTCNHP